VNSEPNLVVGVGARSGVTADEVLTLADAVLAELGASRRSVRQLATVASKATEPGIVEAARRAGWPLVAHKAAALASVQVPNPSGRVQTATGTPSVAEAACLLDPDGRPVAGTRLAVPKRTAAQVTVAVASHPTVT
jgi:cobalamin biosynthesis protein CbiG